jgi:hypothetical protein
LVADLVNTIEALAAVFFGVTPTGRFDAAAGVQLIWDAAWLNGATTEMVAAVLAHEGWHVTQLFTGIHDDFTHYPRVIDVEYEAFVAGTAAWDTLKGSQRELTLDAGSACVAQGEARCKEILATDFGYPIGPRPHSS